MRLKIPMTGGWSVREEQEAESRVARRFKTATACFLVAQALDSLTTYYCLVHLGFVELNPLVQWWIDCCGPGPGLALKTAWHTAVLLVVLWFSSWLEERRIAERYGAMFFCAGTYFLAAASNLSQMLAH